MTDKPDYGNLMEKAKEMQQKMQQLQNQIAATETQGESGGGLVKITMNGRHDAKRVVIADVALRESKSTLEDLIVAAINDAVRKIENISRKQLMKLSSDLGLPPDANLSDIEE